MTLEQLRLELGKRGVVIHTGIIPSLSAEVPVQLSNLRTIGPCSIGAFTYGAGDLYLHYATVGRYCSIAPDVCIGLGNHRTDLFSTHPLAERKATFFKWNQEYMNLRDRIEAVEDPVGLPRTTVGNDVWIGRGVLINDNVTIGDGAIIGAGSVVTTNIPSYAIAVGCPARVKRYRFNEDIIERFSSVKWWEYDLSSLSGIPADPQGFLGIMEPAIASKALPKFVPHQINIGSNSDLNKS